MKGTFRGITSDSKFNVTQSEHLKVPQRSDALKTKKSVLGELVFDKTTQDLYYYDGKDWFSVFCQKKENNNNTVPIPAPPKEHSITEIKPGDNVAIVEGPDGHFTVSAVIPSVPEIPAVLAGDNITITSDPNGDLTVSAVIPPQIPTPTVITNAAAEEGSGESLVASDSSVKSLTAGSGVQLTSDANTVTVSASHYHTYEYLLKDRFTDFTTIDRNNFKNFNGLATFFFKGAAATPVTNATLIYEVTQDSREFEVRVVDITHSEIIWHTSGLSKTTGIATINLDLVGTIPAGETILSLEFHRTQGSGNSNRIRVYSFTLY